jgi:hypothetical protein
MAFNIVSFSYLSILRQVIIDLYSKEVTTGYTTTYTWTANQLGHIALGFIPTILCISIYTYFFNTSPYLFLLSILPVAYMIYKEQQDIKNEKTHYNNTFPIAPLNISDITKNAWTANWFTFFGAMLAGSTVIPIIGLPLFLFFIFSIPSIYICKYWLSKKKCFQQASLPYLYRLFYYPSNKIIGLSQTLDTLEKFQNNEIDHLIVTGPLNSGKTSLGTALGTELSFKQIKIKYSTFINFLNFAKNKDTQKINPLIDYWTWHECDVIILDDVLSHLFDKIKTEEYVEVRRILNLKKIVWILESDQDAKQFEVKLQNMFFNWNIKRIELR